MNIAETIAGEMNIAPWQVEAVIQLIDEGCTIPFIARYRKEKHGSLDDTQLRRLSERLDYLRNLEARREQIRAAVTAQGKMTPELARDLDRAVTMVALEDLYRPYRPKRRTRALIAEEKGLLPLAKLILAPHTNVPLAESAKAYISEKKGVADAEQALAGASDIIAEQISDNADYREGIRDFVWNHGILESEAKDPVASSAYEMYYHFQEPVKRIAGHRVLAVNRGEKEKFLTVRIEADEEQEKAWLERRVLRRDNPVSAPFLRAAAADALKRLILPSIEREIRNALTEQAEDGAIRVFRQNLAQVLMQPPIAGHTVLGWDPGFANGCKLAVVDPTGRVLDTAVVYPTAPSSGRKANPAKLEAAKKLVLRWIRTYHVTLIALGNGTASRESEKIIVDLLKEVPEKISYVITNEAGASVYSASELAAEELPELDVEGRGAASMARRVQDPLAELVKIDPKAIGVGQYQHDMNQKKQSEALTSVVEDCVNRVGVDLNTASEALLRYVSGISPVIAKNIVRYREENGRFDTRRQLLKVPKLGPKAFEQCAGFLRISGGKEPLDRTGVHPESYAAAKELIREAGMTERAFFQAPADLRITDPKKTAEKLGIGEPTLRDILRELKEPGRDPRKDMPEPILRSDVLEIGDLKEGMVLRGTVRNIVDFGAFVDIGVHHDGLVHISQMAKGRFVKHPLDVVKVGDIVEVKVIKVDREKNRIGLSMIL